MFKYINSLEEDLQIMQYYELSAEELFLIKLIFAAQENNGRQSYIVDYFVKCKHSALPLEQLKILAEKNVLISSSIPTKGDKFIADNLVFTNKFQKDWFVYSHEAGKDLMDKYPNYMQMHNGELLPAKNITKVYNSLESLYNAYGKSIRYNRDVHQKVLFLIDWAMQNNLLKYGIAEFVASHKWESLEQDYRENSEGIFQSTYDNKSII